MICLVGVLSACKYTGLFSKKNTINVKTNWSHRSRQTQMRLLLKKPSGLGSEMFAVTLVPANHIE